jgi:hypothetical protein
MIYDDFKFNVETGKFTEEFSDSFVGEAVLRMNIKSKSVSETRPYPGDWFLNPVAGCNAYEVITTEPENVDVVKLHLERSLQPMLSSKRILSAEIKTTVNADRNRFDNSIIIDEGEDKSFSYTHFIEVL